MFIKRIPLKVPLFLGYKCKLEAGMKRFNQDNVQINFRLNLLFNSVRLLSDFCTNYSERKYCYLFIC